jgi:hypothetical protein
MYVYCLNILTGMKLGKLQYLFVLGLSRSKFSSILKGSDGYESLAEVYSPAQYSK